MPKLDQSQCYGVYLAEKKQYKPNIAALRASQACGFGPDVNKFWAFVRSNRIKEAVK